MRLYYQPKGADFYTSVPVRKQDDANKPHFGWYLVSQISLRKMRREKAQRRQLMNGWHSPEKALDVHDVDDEGRVWVLS